LCSVTTCMHWRHMQRRCESPSSTARPATASAHR
jgi:hypothetical protein